MWKPSSLFYILILTLAVMSCDGERGSADLAPEYLYDVQNQKVIKSIINTKRATITIIYGNDLARQNAGNLFPKAKVGACYTVVTWKQKPMPHWYGTNMNGPIYSVETIRIVQKNTSGFTSVYHLEPGQNYKPGESHAEKDQRIRYITAQHAAVFP